MTKDNLYISHYVSKSDVDEAFAKLAEVKTEKPVSLEYILYSLGLDTEYIYGPSAYPAPHRNLRGDIVKCIRYEGRERTDKEWIASGHASLDLLRRRQKKVAKVCEILFQAAKRSAWY